MHSSIEDPGFNPEEFTLEKHNLMGTCTLDSRDDENNGRRNSIPVINILHLSFDSSIFSMCIKDKLCFFLIKQYTRNI